MQEYHDIVQDCRERTPAQFSFDCNRKIQSKELHKPRKCQYCGGAVLSILYGYPSQESFKAASRGENILGGCCIPDDFDKLEDWVCKECDQRYKKIIPLPKKE